MAGGLVVRCTTEPREIPLDRVSLAALPGQPPPGVPLVCLDTETTGLATATGTVAFLIGLGWWEGDRFHQVQLLLPDHADEPALLTALAALHPARRLARHLQRPGLRLAAARHPLPDGPPRGPAPWRPSRPAADRPPALPPPARGCPPADRRERSCSGLVRHGDIDGSEIPGRYLRFLRGGPAEPLAAVVRHNDQDVRSLARLLVLLASGYGTPEARRTAPAGDLGGLARAYARADA